jgi:hypothetical protein
MFISPEQLSCFATCPSDESKLALESLGDEIPVTALRAWALTQAVATGGNTRIVTLLSRLPLANGEMPTANRGRAVLSQHMAAYLLLVERVSHIPDRGTLDAA